MRRGEMVGGCNVVFDAEEHGEEMERTKRFKKGVGGARSISLYVKNDIKNVYAIVWKKFFVNKLLMMMTYAS